MPFSMPVLGIGLGVLMQMFVLSKIGFALEGQKKSLKSSG